MKRFLVFQALTLVCFFGVTLSVDAQLVVANTTPANAVQTFLGPGVQAQNITYSAGAASQLGTFTCTNCNIGIPSGTILSSGFAVSAQGPNDDDGLLGPGVTGTESFDPDLISLSGGYDIYEACVLEFDFVPAGNTLTFNMVFGSEEFPEYADPSEIFNDVFGFFLSGPGISGPYINGAANIAVLPGTSTPITIQNIYNTGQDFSIIMRPPAFSSNPFYAQPDGYTDIIPISAQVQCGQTYHIKLAVADAGDWFYDSWVFLEANSFSSAPLTTEFLAPAGSPPSGNGLYEGCPSGSVVIHRPPGTTGALALGITASGTATAGSDYVAFPSQVVIPAGANQVVLPFTANLDAMTEGTETVILNVTLPGSCPGNPGTTITLTIEEVPPLNVSSQDVTLVCGPTPQVSIEVSGGIGLYTVNWSNNASGTTITVPYQDATYTYVVSDLCGVLPVQGTVNVDATEYPPLVVGLGPDQTVQCLENATVNTSVSGGAPTYTYAWTVDGAAFGAVTPGITFPSGDGATVGVTVTDLCGTTATDEMQVNVTTPPITVVLPSDIQTTCFATEVIVPVEVSGGTGTLTYQWLVNDNEAGSSSQISVTAAGGATVVLEVTDQCGGFGSDQLVITVPPAPITIQLTSSLNVDCMSSFTLTPSASGGLGNLHFEWTIDGEVVSNAPALTYSATSNLVIILRVFDDCGNSSTQSVNVSVNPAPITFIQDEDPRICPGDNAILVVHPVGGIGNYSYTWSTDSHAAQISVSPIDDETYTVNVSDLCGNSAEDIFFVDVLIPVKPLSVGDDPVICTGGSVGTVFEGGITPYYVQYNADSLSFDPNYGFSTSSVGTSWVSVEDYCGAYIEFFITAKVCETLIPNVFTPNGDSKNQFFTVKGIEDFPQTSIAIFNRWGAQVFESSDYKNNWDGGDLQEGTYFYILKRSDGEVFSGHVSLLRK